MRIIYKWELFIYKLHYIFSQNLHLRFIFMIL